jgi:CelD/BcsL family acetyltransferase involved in cellulose biosynthesis
LVVHRQIPQSENLRQQWNALAAQMEDPQVFYTYEWAAAVERAYGQELKPLLFLAYEGDKLRAVASLAVDPQETIVFLAATTADYCDFLSSTQDRASFVSSVLAELRLMQLDKHIPGTLVLVNLPQDSATVRALEPASRKHGYFVFARPAYFCAQVRLEVPEERDRIQQMIQQKKILRRREKEMKRTAPVAVEHWQGEPALEAMLSEFAHAHVGRFLATGRSSNLARPERRLFLRELARRLSAQGWLKMSRLMIGDQAIAWNYGFAYAGTWFWYQPTFDGNFQRYSPGGYLLWRMVEEACGLPDARCVDLGLGAEEYKDKIANGGRQTLHVTLEPAFPGYMRSALRYHAAELVKSVPSVEQRARRARDFANAISRKMRQKGVAGTLRSLATRMRDGFVRRKEVHFYAWPSREVSVRPASDHGTRFVPLDVNTMARAAMSYCDDSETAHYLLRNALRLHTAGVRGYALLDGEDVPVHFCWTAPFENFYMSELSCRLHAPVENATLIFDCWTPCAQRGQGHYADAITHLAWQLRSEKKSAWIFSASLNTASLRGLEKSGFEHRYSLLRKGVLFLDRRIRQVDAPVGLPSAAAAA